MTSVARSAAEGSNSDFDRLLHGQRVMAVLRGLPPEETVELCRRSWRAGIDVVEVPVQVPAAVASLRAAVAAAAEEGRVVGAGTVTTVEQVHTVLDAGAVFTVAPGLDPGVVEASLEAGLPHLPGVATSTEIQRAVGLGLAWLKAFPAAQLTPGWIRAQLAPFPGVKFVATGGLDGDNGAAFLAAGARVVAVGSALADPGQLDRVARLQAG